MRAPQLVPLSDHEALLLECGPFTSEVYKLDLRKYSQYMAAKFVLTFYKKNYVGTRSRSRAFIQLIWKPHYIR